MTERPVQVGILMGSDSDLPVMQAAVKVLDQLEIGSEITVASAHRTPDAVREYCQSAPTRGIKVLVASAGMAAHLAGAVAAQVSIPVIGVPLKASLDGLDALLSTAQMPPGVPVATVAIDGAKNAGLLAAQMIGTGDAAVAQRVSDYKAGLTDQVRAKAAKLADLGIEKYLSQKG